MNKKDIVNWTDISDTWDNTPQFDFTFVDLFSGCGGLTKGLELAWLKGICGLDNYAPAAQTYRRNFKHDFVEGDIKLNITKNKLYETIKRRLDGNTLNIITGGFPCQGFSMAGKRSQTDSRNELYKELLEIVVELQPEFIVCENVVGLRSMLGGSVEKMILNDFELVGYNMNVAVLCAADYYVPQKRNRVIFIGNRMGKTNYHPSPLIKPLEYITVGQSIGDLVTKETDINFNHVPTLHRPDMVKRMIELKEGESLYKSYADAWKKCKWDEPSNTIKESHGGGNIHPKLPRVLTAREMARLQSFPDDFIFKGNKSEQLVQIGNAVPPLLGKAIGLAISKSYQS